MLPTLLALGAMSSSCVICGCGALPPLRSYGDAKYGYENHEANFAPIGHKRGENGDPDFYGRDFCSNVSNAAQLKGDQHQTSGVFFSILASTATIATAILAGTASDTNNTATRKAFTVSLPLIAGVFGYVAFDQFDHKKSAYQLAGTTSAAVSTSATDKRAFEACSLAISVFDGNQVTLNGTTPPGVTAPTTPTVAPGATAAPAAAGAPAGNPR